MQKIQDILYFPGGKNITETKKFIFKRYSIT